MIPYYNFHSHSNHCDGKEKLEDYVKAAIDKNFKAFGFSGHSPLPFENEWSLTPESFQKYIFETKSLKQKYQEQIDLYIGLEIDYIPGHSDNFTSFIKSVPLDYSIGSVHLVKSKENGKIWAIDGPIENYINGVDEVFQGDYKEAVTAFYKQSMEMIRTQKPDIIGHIDKVKMHNKQRWFSTAEPWYQELLFDTLKLAAEHKCIVELNTRGVYTGKTDEYFPSREVLHHCLELGIDMMVNSDAHHPTQLDLHFAEGHQLLKQIGFKRVKTPFFEFEL
jgi:histidinol-phosphatase (PHP family)